MDNVFKTIQSLATVIFSITIAASVAYETGYFSVVGYKYQGLLSVSDYASSALEWLPWLVLLYALGFLGGRFGFSNFIEGAISFRTRRRILFLLMSLFLAILAVILLFVPFYWLLLYAPLAALPLVGAPFLLRPTRSDPDPPVLAAISVSGIVVLIALFCSGIGQAHRDISVIDNAYIIKSSENRAVQILRTLGNGLLVWEPADSRVDFVRWEKVDRLTHLIWKSADARWFDSLGCKLSERFCNHKPPPAP